MWYSLNRLMSQGKQVIVYTPYIICGREMYHDLERLTSGGTEIQIITNDVASGANPGMYRLSESNGGKSGIRAYRSMSIWGNIPAIQRLW